MSVDYHLIATSAFGNGKGIVRFGHAANPDVKRPD